jgi:hypothetical protein
LDASALENETITLSRKVKNPIHNNVTSHLSHNAAIASNITNTVLLDVYFIFKSNVLEPK